MYKENKLTYYYMYYSLLVIWKKTQVVEMDKFPLKTEMFQNIYATVDDIDNPVHYNALINQILIEIHRIRIRNIWEIYSYVLSYVEAC